ncbi:MAG TPA: hypothetical protein PK413_16870, partial [Thermoanaerobaculia bacterium]|nr:hypothetical protein [Thermoanaerobaculia bacterium]
MRRVPGSRSESASSSRLLLRSLPLPLLLALRYLKSSRKDAFSTFLSRVATSGMALGVAALILAQALLAGFQSVLKGPLLARTPEVLVRPAAGADLDALEARLEAEPGARSVRRVQQGRGWVLNQGRSAVAVDIVGASGGVPPRFPGATGSAPGLYLGTSLVSSLGLVAGDPVELVAPRPTLTPLGPQPRLRRLPLAGTFESVPSEDRQRVLVPLEVSRSLFGDAELAFEVEAGGLEAALVLAPRLRTALPGAEVLTWRDLNRPLLFALALEKRMVFLSVLLIVLVSGLALVAALSLLAASKRGELGILGAMGVAPAGLSALFLSLGALIAGRGIVAGGLLGTLGAWALDRSHLLSVPGDVFLVSRVPF